MRVYQLILFSLTFVCKKGDCMKNIFFISLLVFLGACSSKPEKPRGFELPIALREVFRGGQLKGLEDATSPDLGIPNQYDLTEHVCRSAPIFDMNGKYVRTWVGCW